MTNVHDSHFYLTRKASSHASLLSLEETMKYPSHFMLMESYSKQIVNCCERAEEKHLGKIIQDCSLSPLISHFSNEEDLLAFIASLKIGRQTIINLFIITTLQINTHSSHFRIHITKNQRDVSEKFATKTYHFFQTIIFYDL